MGLFYKATVMASVAERFKAWLAEALGGFGMQRMHSRVPKRGALSRQECYGPDGGLVALSAAIGPDRVPQGTKIYAVIAH